MLSGDTSTFRSIQGRLVGQQQMERICAAWGLTGEIKLGDHAFKAQGLIVHRMKSRTAARFVWQRLDRTGRRFLYDLFCSRNPGKGVPIARVQKQLTLTDFETAAIVRQLKEMYVLEEDRIPGYQSARSREQRLSEPPSVRALFLYQECAESLWDTGEELFLPYANREKQPLLQLLRMMHRTQSEHLARLCHVSARSVVSMYSDYAVPSSHPQEMHQGIADALRQAPIFFEVFRTLEPHVQDFFLWLCKKGGRVTMAKAQTHLAEQGCTGNSVYLLFEALENHAFAFDTLQPGGERVVFIHRDLLSDLKDDIDQYALDEQQHALLPTSAPPLAIEEGLPRLLYDLATSVGWSYQYVLEETREGKLPQKWQNKVRPILHGRPRIREHDDQYLDLLFSTAKELGLLSCSSREEEKPRYRPTAFLAHWQHMTLGEQTRRFLEWWGKSPTWCDVQPNGKVIDAPDTTVVKARKALLEHLTACSPGKWYRISSLLFAIWHRAPLYAPDFYRSQQPELLSVREHRARWMEMGEGQIHQALLLSTLYEAGVISLGYDQADPQTGIPDLFQFSELGAAALGEDASQREVSLLPEEQKRLIVQPNFQIVLLQFETDLIYQLIQFATITTIDRVSRFTLTQEALLRSLEAGNQLEDILSFLSTESKHGLPQNIEYSLHDWAKAYKEARISPVLLIELLPNKCEADLSRALADLEVDVRRLAPGIFTLATDAIPFSALRKRLEKEGLVVRGEPPAQSRWK